MTSYKDSGVDVELGDKCSKIAYEHARNTFLSRKGLIGEPVMLAEGFFGGAIDMGEFYLTQSEDTVGTKILIAEALNIWDTLAYDLLAMVLDDTVCMGAEVVSLGNTIDTPKVEEFMTEEMTRGLEKACKQQRVIALGGEIAESGKHLNHPTWGASAVGILEKNKLLNPSDVEVGDVLIGLKSGVFRCNGISLVRHVLNKAFGENWIKEPYGEDKTWGEIVLTPSIIYHNCVLEMIGRYKQEREVDIHGIAHITGGGIPSKLARILKKNEVGVELNNLFDPHPAVKKIQELGDVSDNEAYLTWNMGTGMILALPESEAQKTIDIAAKHNIEAQIVGSVVENKGINIKSKGAHSNNELLSFEY